ncbi:MAG: hypothetical protein IKP45_05625 [Bacteroidales bacterium]|nr:hypothetical protein [Bacteroidales bacterium]
MATNCMSVTSGFCGSLCRNSAGGVQRFYIVNTSDIDKTSLTYGTDGELTEMELDGNMFAYVPFVDSANWTETINVAPENGTIYYEQVANMVLGANAQALRNIVNELGRAANIVVLVLDNNDKMWMIGDPTGKRMTWLSGGDSNSGTAYGDRNGWSLNITCRNSQPAIEVVPANASKLAESIASADAVCDGTLS